MPASDDRQGWSGACCGCLLRPSTWVALAAIAVAFQVARVHLLDRGLLLEGMHAMPDPALNLLEDLNLMQPFKAVESALEERRNLATLPVDSFKDKLRPRHPAVLIPGLVSCGLEVWQARECLGGPGGGFFRSRIWGSVNMARMVLNNITCWLEHMSLDPITGLDPPGIAIRAAEGFSGADYFIPGYWLWSWFIENAAAIGYNPSNFHMACYDWRLTYSALERRDGYFSRLRFTIETLVRTTGHKAVLIGHSMGANVAQYFMQWVSRAAGPDWVSAHIHAYIPFAGAVLGAVGPLGALLSGEMQYTAILGPLNKLLESQMMFLNKVQIRDFLRTWGSLGALLPKGGDAVWGSAKNPTDITADLVTNEGRSYSFSDMVELLRREMGDHPAIAEGEQGAGPPLQEASSNPLVSALPTAPEMRIFCLYGVGIETERAYRYAKADSVAGKDRFGMIDYRYSDNQTNSTGRARSSDPSTPVYASGVASTDGDGTVPLISEGYMCAGAWREEKLRAFNPSRTPVHIREYLDQSNRWEDLRGGPATGKHVEILGNREVILDILHILAGNDTHIRAGDRIHSEILSIAKRVNRNLEALLGAGARG